jgi:hypothetical protein
MGVFLAKMRFLRLNAEKSRRFPESLKIGSISKLYFIAISILSQKIENETGV